MPDITKLAINIFLADSQTSQMGRFFTFLNKRNSKNPNCRNPVIVMDKGKPITPIFDMSSKLNSRAKKLEKKLEKLNAQVKSQDSPTFIAKAKTLLKNGVLVSLTAKNILWKNGIKVYVNIPKLNNPRQAAVNLVSIQPNLPVPNTILTTGPLKRNKAKLIGRTKNNVCLNVEEKLSQNLSFSPSAQNLAKKG